MIPVPYTLSYLQTEREKKERKGKKYPLKLIERLESQSRRAFLPIESAQKAYDRRNLLPRSKEPSPQSILPSAVSLHPPSQNGKVRETLTPTEIHTKNPTLDTYRGMDRCHYLLARKWTHITRVR